MKMSHELQTAIRAAQEAGKIQLQHFGKPLQKTMKIKKDFATPVDFACEKKILGVLQQEFPDHGILSEEKGEIASDSDYRWIVDPLDGTIAYAFGLPFFGVMIALQKKQELQLGVVFKPFEKQVLVAEKNKGTFVNGQLARVSNTQTIEDAHVWYGGIQYPLNNYPQALTEILNKAAYRTTVPWIEGLTPLIQGNVDVYLGDSTHLWDIAAPKIIVEEAGGVFSNYRNETQLEKIDGIVVANPVLHKKTMEIFAQPGASR